ncbi:redoxin domain-containing protein [Hydrogenibacillus schlegelii]|uniref:Thiol-disulfide oxidoreductase n=1 Tax=Hydrogenibacillus schlegelii TaxID=1484 RepID=A0A179IML4_HYDSH|nr:MULTISPECIES: redoxin domain-containing protein [Hydrogenibacillus]OAR03917.1 thiol-disulfide oxidoreductase [Hydrogenibacillus schlegelii]QZA33914.1 redoxin domain-containing protein [Hydrogenibacillus sp. N12]
MKNRAVQAGLVVLLLAGAAWVIWSNFVSRAEPIEVGRPAPDFTAALLDGGTVTLSELRGHPVLLNFWATYCPSCIDEMPAIESVYQKFKDDGFIVIGINTGESAVTIQGYVRRTGVTYPIALDREATITKRYRVYDLPRSIFIAPDGTVAVDHIGPMTAEMVERFYAKAITGR